VGSGPQDLTRFGRIALVSGLILGLILVVVNAAMLRT
jgi:hypothetical protein